MSVTQYGSHHKQVEAVPKRSVSVNGNTKAKAPSYSQPHQWEKKASAAKRSSGVRPHTTGSSTPHNKTNMRKK